MQQSYTTCGLQHLSYDKNSATQALFFSPEAAQRGKRDAQIRRDIPQLHPLAYPGKLLLELLIPFLGRQGEPLLMGTMQAPVLILMDNPPPIGQLDIRLEQPGQVGQRYPVSHHIFQRFYKFLTRLVIVQLVHAEDNAPFPRERSGHLFPIDQPKGTGHSFFDEISRFAKGILLYQLIFFGKAAQGHTFRQCPYRILGKRIQRIYVIDDVRHLPKIEIQRYVFLPIYANH